jgi:hypothetical protein
MAIGYSLIDTFNTKLSAPDLFSANARSGLKPKPCHPSP